jgi:hypothetical protein
MNRKMLIILALQALIIVILFWMLVFYGKDEFEAGHEEDEEVISAPSLVSTEHGAVTVTLSPQAQEQSGIAVTRLEGASHRGEIVANGGVVGIDELLDQRKNFLAALAEADVVRASISSKRQEYERLEQLNHDNRNVSDRAVEAALASWKAEEARLAAAATDANNWRDAMRQQWGATLAGWAAQQPAAAPLQSLLLHQEALLQITLPFDAPAPDLATPLAVTPAGAVGKRVPARLISAAPRSEGTLPGKTYFYRAAADSLRTGMRVTARLPAQKQATAGVLVPDAAIVWFANQSWAYHKTAQDKFVRKPVRTDIETPNGWFNSKDILAPGEEVVTRGAQLLLSEEFKYQITNENDD